MKQHVVSIFPVNVDPTEDDPRTVGWRFTCSCRPWRGRTVTWLVREKAEAHGAAHLRYVGSLAAQNPAQAKQETILGDSGQEVTQNTGGGYV